MAEAAERGARRSRTFFKYALCTLGVLILLIGAAVAYFIATFDPRDYRDYIVRAVEEKTGRRLTLGGEMSLSIWPDVAVRLGEVTLSERASEEPFLKVEKARITLALGPLLSREFVASELVLTNATAIVTRYEDGRLNIDDLLGGEGPAPQFEIARLAVERSTLVYRDLGSGARYELTDLDLQTGRIAKVADTPLALAVTVRAGTDDVLLQLKLKGALKLDLDAQQYALSGAAMDVKGRVPGFSDFIGVAKGDVGARMKPGELQVSGLSARLRGLHGQDELQLELSAADFLVAPLHATAQQIRLALVAKGTAGTTNVNLALPAAERDANRLGAPSAAFELTAQRGAHRIATSASAAIDANIDTRTITLNALDGTLSVVGPQLPNKGLTAALKGDARVDLRGENVRLNVAGKLAQTGVSAQIGAAGFAAPVYTFSVKLDELDLDKYLASSGDTSRKSAPAPDASLLKTLADIPATGTVTVGVLKSADVKASNVRFEIK